MSATPNDHLLPLPTAVAPTKNHESLYLAYYEANSRANQHLQDIYLIKHEISVSREDNAALRERLYAYSDIHRGRSVLLTILTFFTGIFGALAITDDPHWAFAPLASLFLVASLVLQWIPIGKRNRRSP